MYNYNFNMSSAGKYLIGHANFRCIRHNKNYFEKTYFSLPEMKDLINKIKFILGRQRIVKLNKKIVSCDNWLIDKLNKEDGYIDKINVIAADFREAAADNSSKAAADDTRRLQTGRNNILFDNKYSLDSAGITLYINYYTYIYTNPISYLKMTELRDAVCNNKVVVDIFMEKDIMTRYDNLHQIFEDESAPYMNKVYFMGKKVKIGRCYFKNIDKFIEELKRCEAAGITFNIPHYLK